MAGDLPASGDVARLERDGSKLLQLLQLLPGQPEGDQGAGRGKCCDASGLSQPTLDSIV